MAKAANAMSVWKLSGLLIALCVAGCGGHGGGAHHYYPASFERSFTASCMRTSHGQRDYCKCALGYVESKVSPSDLAAMAGDLSRKDRLFRDAGRACN